MGLGITPVDRNSPSIYQRELQLLLRSWEELDYLEDELACELGKTEQKTLSQLKEEIEAYFASHGWYIGNDDFRGAALCTRPYPHSPEQAKE